MDTIDSEILLFTQNMKSSFQRRNDDKPHKIEQA